MCYTKIQVQTGNWRLLKLAAHMRTLPRARKGKRTIDMSLFVHRGSPSCPLGHLASMKRTPFRVRFVDGNPRLFGKNGEEIGHYDQSVCDYFAIRVKDADAMFGRSGCAAATTPLEVAKYIEQFVAQRKA